jgi:hypothetical protein
MQFGGGFKGVLSAAERHPEHTLLTSQPQAPQFQSPLGISAIPIKTVKLGA